jgi:DNA polymerase III subunit epsilon
MESFLPSWEFPPCCPPVLDRIREAAKMHVGGRSPLYLFFDVEVIGSMPEYKSWDRWDVSHLEEAELADFPHILQFAWILCDEHQHVFMARNMIARPNGFEIPPLAEEVHGISHEKAMLDGVPIKDILSEFCNGLAPSTRIITFDAAVDGVVTEIELRRSGLPAHLNRLLFYDLREKSRALCALPNEEDDEDGFRAPQLEELYDKILTPFGIQWHHASADVQVIQKCFFQLLKMRVL